MHPLGKKSDFEIGMFNPCTSSRLHPERGKEEAYYLSAFADLQWWKGDPTRKEVYPTPKAPADTYSYNKPDYQFDITDIEVCH